MLRRTFLLCSASVLALSAMPAFAQDADAEKTRQAVIAKAAEYLQKKQNDNGSWGGPRFQAGVSGIVVTGLVKTAAVPTDSSALAKGVTYIESLIDAKEGHIAGKMPGLQNYITCVNVMALQAVNKPEKYKPVVNDAVKYLKQLQFDDGENKKEADGEYGGVGYDAKSRPDLSNTQFFLDALKEAGVPQDDPALKKALIFVSRSQNLKTEFNDRPWAGKINDGSFIYGATIDDKKSNAGYGSMTYAGIKSMIYCGVSKDDARYKKAVEWISANYTLDKHPGMAPGQEGKGLYYYYHTLAKSLSVVGIDKITTTDKVEHDWRTELINTLAKKQKPDGSFVNDLDQFQEGDPALTTGFALLALSYCKK
jgi:squalene-hopene/tetraprenyl-beta-curcumene cyclase